MKKVLVLSDSHGDVRSMVDAVNAEKPDLILHLGDCWKDAVKLKKKCSGYPMEMVVGNCDWDQAPEELLLEVEGFRILMCHGHRYSVKFSLLNLELAAKEKGADVVLFGHTHRVYYDYYDGIRYLNPGSIGNPPVSLPPSYGILYLDQEEHLYRSEIRYLEVKQGKE